MRVLHIVSSLEIGGAERLVVDLAHAQQLAGLEASIVDLGRHERPLAEAARGLGVRVVRAGRLRSRLLRGAALGGLLAWRDHAIHLHNPWALRAVLPILPAIRGRVIYTRHGASPYGSRLWRALHRLARPFIDRITFVTDEARAAFELTHGHSPGHHVVIENGVAVAAEPPHRPRPLRLRVGMVGRLVELKGQRLVLEAIAALPPDARTRVEAHVFGDGLERERLAEYARASLSDVAVVFHGTVIDRKPIYDAIDVLAVGSRMEGQSMAIMEAMARGVPVIATNVGGNAQLVRDGETGVLVPPGDSTAIQDAVVRMLADPDLVTRLGRASHARIVAHHSIDAVAAKYRELYAGRP